MLKGKDEMINKFHENTFHFECPNCGYPFKPPVHLLLFAFHIGFNVFLVCPHCGYRGLMPVIKDDK
jgi:uncharacterized C2H2 Zn-finger protein